MWCNSIDEYDELAIERDGARFEFGFDEDFLGKYSKALEKEQFHQTLREVVDPFEYRILCKNYGLNCDIMSQSEIGEEIGMSRG